MEVIAGGASGQGMPREPDAYSRSQRSEHLGATLSNHDRVLKVSREATVLRDDRPLSEIKSRIENSEK